MNLLPPSLAVVTALLFAQSAHAQEQTPFPVKPLRMVVNFPAGGPSDAIARPLAQRVTEQIGQQVIVDFRGGAAGNIGADHVAKSPGDGYTLLLITSSFNTNPALTPNLPFDPIRDFAPVTPAAASTIVFVANPSVPARNVKELVALARKHPGKITFASSGQGGSLHLFAELFKMLANVNLLHVPYKGAAPGLVEVVGGQVETMFIALPQTLPHIKSGRLRALGVGNVKRAGTLPDVPTIAEQGVAGYEVNSHFGVLAPGTTPRDIVTRLNGILLPALQSASVRERYAAGGSEPVWSTPDAYAAFIRNEIGKWGKVVKQAGLKPE